MAIHTGTLGPNVYDQYGDSGEFLGSTLGGRPVPALVKTAADASSMMYKSEEDFALVADTPAGRQYLFPVVDKANAVVSALYFERCEHELPPAMRKEAAKKLLDALTSFGVQPSEGIQKTASVPLGFSDEDGNPTANNDLLNMFADTSDMEVLKDAFANETPRGKRRLAFHIKEAGFEKLAAAGQTDDELAEMVRMYGGETFGNLIASELQVRDHLTGQQYTQSLTRIKEKVASAELSPEDLVAGLEVFDNETGLFIYYGGQINDPVAAVFGNRLVKTASPKIKVGSREISEDAVRGIAENNGEQLRGMLGDSFARQFAAAPVEVFKSLPVPHQQMIMDLGDAD